MDTQLANPTHCSSSDRQADRPRELFFLLLLHLQLSACRKSGWGGDETLESKVDTWKVKGGKKGRVSVWHTQPHQEKKGIMYLDSVAKKVHTCLPVPHRTRVCVPAYGKRGQQPGYKEKNEHPVNTSGIPMSLPCLRCPRCALPPSSHMHINLPIPNDFPQPA